MRSDDGRWPSATAISIAVHAALMLGTCYSSSRSGSGSDLIFDLRASARVGPRFEPGVVVPIELANVEPGAREAKPAVGLALEPSVGVSELGERSGPADVTGSAPSRGHASEPEPPGPLAAELPSRSDGLLHGRGASAGLLGDGHEDRSPDPGLLRGSQALYEESAGSGGVEGPRRPSRPGVPPGKDYSFEREGNDWVYRDPGGAFVATLQPDGSVDFRNKLVDVKVGSEPTISGDGEEFITLVVEHDAVGVAKVARGRDPSPRAKAQLLAATFETRLEVAQGYQKQRLLDQLGALDDELGEIWNASGRSLAERKRLLFELWDGCDELAGSSDADTSELDAIRKKYAGAARRKIIRFITEVAPAGSPEAYTSAELADFNEGRVSAERFDPY